MKSVLKVLNMRTAEDINIIRSVISKNEGVVACQISKEKGEISIVYDSFFLKEDYLVEQLEDLGYGVI